MQANRTPLDEAAHWSAPDLEGHEESLLDPGGNQPSVLFFVAVDCPISNQFAPEVNRIAEEYGARGVRFTRIYCDPDVDAESIRAHARDYGFAMPARLDADHALVRRVGAEVVPTVAVLDGSGELRYRGRIDDRYVDFGKQRAAPTRRDLRLALDALLAGGVPEVVETEAVGCYIAELVD